MWDRMGIVKLFLQDFTRQLIVMNESWPVVLFEEPYLFDHPTWALLVFESGHLFEVGAY